MGRSTNSLRQQRRVAWFLLVSSILAFACWQVGYTRIFSSFGLLDDEGYMLSLLRETSRGGALYSEIYSQYGPLYHWVWNGLFSLLGLDYTHDNGRLVTLSCWILSTIIMAIAAWRQSRSVLQAAATQVMSFFVLTFLANEPMHPIGLLSVLLSTLYLVLTLKVSSNVRSFESGCLVAAMGAVKINFGVLSGIAIMTTFLWQLPLARKNKFTQLLSLLPIVPGL